MVDLLEKGKYYRIEDPSYDPNFFMIGKVTLPNNDQNDSSGYRGNATFINNLYSDLNIDRCWCYSDSYCRNAKPATQQEIDWLEACIKENKYIQLDDFLKTYKQEINILLW